MAGKSNIEWTEQTWNPFAGCSVLTPGCKRCYAMKMAARLEAMGQELYAGLTEPSKAGPVWTGEVRLAPEHTLLAPLKRKKPTMYFVNSMSDLFHEAVPDAAIDKVFAIMALSPQHTFQVLTKRAERMRAFLSEWSPERLEDLASDFGYSRLDVPDMWPLPNVWLGVSAERQQEWDERSEYLRATPAAVTFVSCEPLLGPIRFHPCRHCNHPGNVTEWPCRACKGRRFEIPDWVIVGGESGHVARPFNLEWADCIVEQCKNADVPCFVKQLGSLPMSAGYPHPLKDRKGGDPSEWPDRLNVRAMPERVRA